MNYNQQPVNGDPFQEEQIDLKRLFFKYLPNWYWFVICVVLALVAASLVTRLTEPVYRVKTTVLIRDDKSFSPAASFMREFDMFGTGSNWFNEVNVIKSRTMVDSVLNSMEVDVSYYYLGMIWGSLRRTEIYKESPFRVYYDKESTQPYDKRISFNVVSEQVYEIVDGAGVGGLKDGERFQFGEVLQGDRHSFRIDFIVPYNEERHKGMTYQFVINDMRRLTRSYLGSLGVEPIERNATIVEISLQATNQQRAIEFLNTLTATYINQGLTDKNRTALSTIRFIDEQIDRTSEVLMLAESSLQQFRRDRRMVDVGLQSTQLLNELQLLDKEKSVEDVKRQYYNYLLEYVRDARDFSEVFGPTTMGIDDPLMNALLVDLSKLYAERSRLLLTVTERSPAVLAIDRNINQANASLEETIRSVQAASNIQLGDLNRRIRLVERRINELPQTERELVGIQRQFNLSDATYNYLLEKRAEAGIALASNQPDHKVVDDATFDRTVSPRNMMNYAIALALGLFVPVAFITTRNFLNTTIIDKNEVTTKVKFPIVGIVPHHKVGRKGEPAGPVVLNSQRSPILEAFRTMRTNLQFFDTGSDKKLIMVTSTRSMEGKTFTAMNLAAVLAMTGKKTVLIGSDMRKPALHLAFGLERDPGLSNYLIGKATIDQVVQKTPQHEQLYLIASGPIPPNPTELLENPRMEQLLTELREFDYIVIDTAPLGVVPDAFPLISKAGICIYVVRQRFTEHSALDFINEFTQTAGIRNLAININDVKLARRQYGYGHGYGYGYGYGYGAGYGYHEEEKGRKRKSRKKTG